MQENAEWKLQSGYCNILQQREEYYDQCVLLIIHLEFPCAQGHNPATYIKANPVTGVENIMVCTSLSKAKKW